MQKKKVAAMECLICGSRHLELLEKTKFGLLVTGNRKTYGESDGIEKCICVDCGHIQYMQNTLYKRITEKIFKDYEVLHNKSFVNGMQVLREHLVIAKVISALSLPDTGNFLDIGCGGGEAMYFFQSKMPGWNVYGMDIGEEFEQQVTERTGGGYFKSLLEIRNSGKRFDLVTINYVLSVADNQGEILDCIKNVLSDRGVLFIIDTDFEIQPYTLNIVEVSSFITKKSLSNILIKKGYAEFFPEFVHDKKEIWAFAMVNEQREYKEQNLYEENCRIYKTKIEYLNNVVDVVEKYYMLYDKLAIFGMSNAGIWVLEIIEKLGKGKNRLRG